MLCFDSRSLMLSGPNEDVLVHSFVGRCFFLKDTPFSPSSNLVSFKPVFNCTSLFLPFPGGPKTVETFFDQFETDSFFFGCFPLLLV